MSTLSVTTINTPDNTTPLYITTQNTTVGITLHPANGTIQLRANEIVTPTGKLGVGKQTFWIPALGFTPRLTNGPALAQYETATYAVNARTYDFDPGTYEAAQIQIKMPKHWDKGTISFSPVWTQLTSSAGAVSWNLKAVAVSSSENMDTAFGTPITLTSSGGTGNTIYVGAESNPVTIAGSPAEGDTIIIELGRHATGSGDTLAIDAKLIGVNIYYTANNHTDA